MKQWINNRILKPMVKRLVNCGQAIFAKCGFNLLRKHYYSPVPEWKDLPEDYFDRLSTLSGVNIDENTCFETMDHVARNGPLGAYLS